MKLTLEIDPGQRDRLLWALARRQDQLAERRRLVRERAESKARPLMSVEADAVAEWQRETDALDVLANALRELR